MFLGVGIKNTHFKIEQQSRRLQPGLNRHAVAVIDDLFIHHNIHNESLFKYPVQYLVEDRQEEKKYFVCVEIVYQVKQKFRED